MRVHELAKELRLPSKTLLDVLAGMKVAVKSHSSTLDDAVIERVRRQVKSKGKSAVVEEPAAPSVPMRDAKTPTGERILGMRKIAPPPVVEAPPVQAPTRADAVEAPVKDVTAERASPPRVEPIAPPKPAVPSAPAAKAAPPKAPVAPPRVEPETPKPKPAVTKEPQAPVAPKQAPVAPRVVPRETKAPPRRIMPSAPPPPARVMPQEPLQTEAPPVKPVALPEPLPTVPPPGMRPPAPPAAPGAPRVPRKIRERFPPPPPELPSAPPVVTAEIELTGSLSVGELAAKLGLSAGELVKRLLELGVLAGINQQILLETAAKAAESFGATVHKSAPAAQSAAGPAPRRLEVERGAASVQRPPVVTIMGHVNHGKTSLLDAIRQTNVAGQEFGGITQHIGASVVDVDSRRIVFIDTPGHEAFTTLRARGAQVTDIAVLVVAVDDGVMPQTVEAINHAKSAGVPIIVAINKIDLPQANSDRVKQQLAELGLSPEEWGGDTVTVSVSARTRQGLKELLEMILLVSDLRELHANPARPARGTIIEAQLDKGRGAVATVLVQEGTLHIGDAIVAGEASGRVRAMVDARGRRVTEAPPATPVEVVGLDAVPQAGDLLEVVRDDRLAKAVIQERRERRRAADLATARPGAAEDTSIQAAGLRELRLILKADTHGSVEALTGALGRLGTAEVGVTMLHMAVGNVTESDVMLAGASRALVIGFNIRPEPQVRKLAEQEQVEILTYRVIYEAIDDIRNRLRGLLAPKRREVSLGQAEVRETFTISKVGTIAGCYVSAGVVARGANLRVIRDGVIIHEGKIASLRRFKEDVREVTEGFECGIALERFQDIKVGDLLEAFEVREEPP